MMKPLIYILLFGLCGCQFLYWSPAMEDESIEKVKEQQFICKSDKDCKDNKVCDNGVCIVSLKKCNEVQSGPCRSE